jgi:hypothetical protein
MDQGLPEEQAKQARNYLAMVVLLVPSQAQHLEALFQNYRIIQPYLVELTSTFCSLFRENSVVLR